MNRKKFLSNFLLKSFHLSSNVFHILIFIIIQYWFHQICLFESKHYARNFPYLTFQRTFPLNKGINVFEIRVETLLFKPMDKLTCYPVITPLKDPMRNLIGSFLSLFPPPSLLFLPHHSYKELSTSSLGGKLNSLACIARNYFR